MQGKYMKILHGMSDIAGQASYSISGLRKIGYKANLVVFRRNIYGFPVDIDLHIGYKKILYPWYLIKIMAFAIYAFFKYDIYHFHFGHSLIPYSLDLFWLKLFRKKFIMEFHGSDLRWMFYRVMPKYWPETQLPYQNQKGIKNILRIFKYSDTIILHDEELRKHFPSSLAKVFIVPLRINVEKFTPKYPEVECVRPVIVHAPTNYIMKGSEYILKAIDNLHTKYNFEFILVQGKTQDEALKIYEKADIIIDQLFLQTYGVFAVEAMSMGKPVISYISKEMKENFPNELPIVSATVDSIEDKIEFLLNNPEKRNCLGKAGRQYVEDYHDYKKIAQVQYDIYRNNIEPMNPIESFYYVKSKGEKQVDEKQQ